MDADRQYDETTESDTVQSESTELVGKTIGDYQVLELIGTGGYGHVYRARHPRMDRIVAIKVLPAELAQSQTIAERFAREVRAAAKLLHPNIVTAFDAGTDGKIPYLVMELIDGLSLDAIVRQHGPLPVSDAIECVRQAATGLNYAHRHRLIHRDIKPKNIMRDRDGTVKILDMGLARLRETANTNSQFQGEGLTQYGRILGTVDYMSPEQANNSHQVDHRTDIYSLGCTLYFMLAGKPPYKGRPLETMYAHAHSPVPSLRDVRSDVPAMLEILFKRMMAKEPDHRIDSMDEIIAELEQCNRSSSLELSSSARSGLHLVSSSDSGSTDHRFRAAIVRRVPAIDVGTCAMRVAFVGKDQQLDTIPNASRQLWTPSLVTLGKQGFHVGESVQGEKMGVVVARNIRRTLATRGESPSEHPVELYLAVLIRQAMDDFRREVGYSRQAVLAVPGCFSEPQRKSLQDAGFIASLDVLDIINESTAAAISLAYRRGQLFPRESVSCENWFVFRLGGGSCEAAVIEVEGPSFRTRAIAGDHRLGGCDWDERVRGVLETQLLANLPSAEARKLASRLDTIAIDAKERLTTKETVKLRYQIGGELAEARLDRAALQESTKDLLVRVDMIIAQALADARITPQDIDRVVLTGGAARLPMVRELVARHVGTRRITEHWADDAAAQGAALWASVRHDAQGRSCDIRIIERSVFSLGVVVYDRRAQPRKLDVIPRNVELPTTRRIVFKTIKEDQDSMALRLVVGDSDDIGMCTILGECHIDQLPLGAPAGTPVEIEFQLAANGRLSISVQSPITFQRVPVAIERPNSLSQAQCAHWRDWLDTSMLTGDFAD